MNKIVLDKESVVDLEIIEHSICNISSDYNICKLNIKVNDGVEFILNHFNDNILSDLDIKVNQGNNSIFKYNCSFLNKNNYNLNIDVLMNGNNSENIINIHGISDGGITNIKVDGNVLKDTISNSLDEKIRMLNINNGCSYIEPNMFISTKNIVANHCATISDIDNDYLFYLNSKGISEEVSKKIIIDGFLKISEEE